MSGLDQYQISAPKCVLHSKRQLFEKKDLKEVEEKKHVITVFYRTYELSKHKLIHEVWKSLIKPPAADFYEV